MSEPRPQFQITTGRAKEDNRRCVVVMLHNASITELATGKLVPAVGLEVQVALDMAKKLTECAEKILNAAAKKRR